MYLLRHAKSSWDDPALADHDRPLGPRGLHDAPLIAQVLAARAVQPELVICSTSLRTRQTAELILPILGVGKIAIDYSASLYESSYLQLLYKLRAQPDRVRHLMLIGHNPGLTVVANYLCPAWLNNLPTCACYALGFEQPWAQLAKHSGQLLFFERPKDHR